MKSTFIYYLLACLFILACNETEKITEYPNQIRLQYSGIESNTALYKTELKLINVLTNDTLMGVYDNDSLVQIFDLELVFDNNILTFKIIDFLNKNIGVFQTIGQRGKRSCGFSEVISNTDSIEIFNVGNEFYLANIQVDK